VFDGSSVRAEDVSTFLRRVTAVETRITTLLPGARLALSPTSALLRYQRAVSAQSLLILLIGLPVIGLILIFVALTADSMVERQRLEIAILKSRGSTSAQIATTYILQSITLGVIALALGLPLGQMAAQAMGSTRQFLTFAESTSERTIPLSVVITRDSVRFAGLALLLALGATMMPALRAARLTIVVAKQAISRPRHLALGRQIASDLLLLATAGYGYYLLKGQGRITLLQWGQGADPWENPILFLAPTLFLLAGARLYLHALPPGLHLLGWLTARLPGTTALLAVRNLARNSHRYTALIALLILTTGLGTFTASVARTLDDNLTARIYYQVGADIAVAEAVGRIGGGGSFNLTQASGSVAPSFQGPEIADEPIGWAILPVSEHQKVAGVLAAARVGVFKANVRVGDQTVIGHLYGIDRVDFPGVAYFRRDFAPASLGALMNALALDPAGILVRREFLARAGLQVGDPIRLRGLIAGSSQPLLFKVVGVLDLFPTAYPGEEEFFVTNLEYIFTELGGPVPYYVWLAVDEAVDEPTLIAHLEEVGFKVLELEDARGQIAAAQARPERIGLFGFLSLGFIITTLLSMLALGLHAFLTYRQRFIQLGIMRAIGLSARQVAASLAGEQMLTTTLSILGGAALGLIVSHLFIPFMQIGPTEADLIPPFTVIIAQRDVFYAVTALITASLGITGGVIWLLSRLQVFQAIKLGEALG
jgi:putative ABC transport system permease protein